ncbi:c-type cytochrome biogenesis protein CcmI [Rhodospirillaceae bacterium KN72]|uniref:C-type cytochrome biogenesis protein CcmI n=1 Tax=Pacificispira spongiicola TaxID=2729598 RepID=A0A7Y0E0E9_9PROT|nr:c-type cytochrome biogenesis protein CcmI [Pacificispira spongiicola]NMM44953.1 c-type cytochrome biogenesis protein CcmI [Pacificispira spongiicola]
MMFWVFSAAVTVLVAAVLLRPLLRADKTDNAPPSAADYDVSVFSSQLREVESDLERGRITPEEAEASRVEIGRRLLAADKRAAAASRRSGFGATGRAIAGVSVIGGLALAVAIYLDVGSPSRPDMPLALRGAELERAAAGDAAAQQATGDLDGMADRLRARLEAGQGTAEDWTLLARTEMMRGRYNDAAAAYVEALKEIPDDPGLNAAYGEALVFAADGAVDDGAANVFRHVLDLAPDDPRARFYLGEYALQNGRDAEALDAWIAMIDTADPGASWIPAVRQRIEAVAGELGIDVSDRLPDIAASPGPSTADIAAAQDMSPEDRQAMVRGMVDGLAARLADDPSDFDGWMRLIRARIVLNEPEAAQQALDQAAAQFSNAPFPLRQLASLADELGLTVPAAAADVPRGPSSADVEAAQNLTDDERRDMIAGMVGTLAARLEENPNDLQGWTMLGRSYVVLGRLDEAAQAYATASDLAPDDVGLLIDRARLLRQIAGDRQTDETVALMRRVLEHDPENVEALWFLGLDTYRAGEREAARTLFDRAIGALPEGSAERAALTDEINRLFTE